MRTLIAVAALATTLIVGGCGTSSPTAISSPASPPTAYVPPPSSSVACQRPVVAIDPGHNATRVESFDPVTGVAQIDYPNGAEDANAFTVAAQIAKALRAKGYGVVLLKRSTSENVSYRERVTRAERAGASIAVSIHTSPGVNAVFPQRVGLYREGPSADGTTKRVTFTNADVARRSQSYSMQIARERSHAQGTSVRVQDNDFGGRAPLWSGNIPIISLMSVRVPWVYNEFSAIGAGGSVAVAPTALRTYSAGLIAGITAALPIRC